MFRRKCAPERYEENDVYFASRHLTPTQRLPEPDLLKALHAYASDYYSEGFSNTASKSFRSLDCSALLAMGILMEKRLPLLLTKPVTWLSWKARTKIAQVAPNTGTALPWLEAW